MIYLRLREGLADLVVQGIDIRIDELPQIKVSDIIIQKSFKYKLPMPWKIKRCYGFYRKYHKFDRYVELNENYELVDGYVAYLVAKMLDIETVPTLLPQTEKEFVGVCLTYA